jgi:polyhydroxyalkanoate synthesis regulator phasin
MDPKQVADMFVDAGWLNAEEGHALSQEAATTGKPIENVMVEHDIVTEDQFFALIAESHFCRARRSPQPADRGGSALCP